MSSFKFEKSESYKFKSKSFIVEIFHWNDYGNKNRWNIYVWFYPEFPKFQDFEDDICFNDLPFEFHGGTTYCLHSYDKSGNVQYKKYGCDYMHLYDDRFETYKNIDEAYEVLYDAKCIFNKLLEIESEH